MSIQENLHKILESIPETVKLVAVSKTKPNNEIMEAYDAGQRIFGENKVQDLAKKWEELPKDIEWHFIGHLQTNKVKYIASFISLLHAVDSLKLLKEVNKQAKKNNRIIDCLLQIYIAKEETKFGLDKDEIFAILASEDYLDLSNVRIVGLMGMATYTEDEKQIISEFKHLSEVYEEVRNTFFKDKDYFAEKSLGMSNDYKIAIEKGSTMIRIGSTIFGARNY